MRNEMEKDEQMITIVSSNIYQKLLSIQKQVKGLSKDKKSHNYEYVTGNKLLSFIKPLMDEQGLILKQEVLSIDNDRMDYKTKYSEKSEILSKVMMRFTWIDTETGDKDENLFGANGQNDWEKGLGSALTYAERYFLLKYFHIATDEDDIDNPNRKPQEKTPQEPKKININEKQVQQAIDDNKIKETLAYYDNKTVRQTDNGKRIYCMSDAFKLSLETALKV